MKINNSDVTVIIPTKNEEKSIGNVVRDLIHLGYKDVVIIDGHSKDRTVEIAKKFGVNVILQNGTGKGDALLQVFDEKLNGKLIAIIDADGSMNPKEIPRLVEALNSGADMAKGSRFIHPGYSEDLNLVRRIGNLFFLLLVKILWSADYTDLCYGFGAFKAASLKRLYPNLTSRNFEIETEICIKARKLGFKVVEVPSVELRRRHGKSNLKAIQDGYLILRTIFREFVAQKRNLDVAHV